MTVLINFKICDNVSDCNGIKSCPFGAFYFDEQKDTIAINQGLCRNCGKCEKSCLVGAIRVAKTKAEEIQIQKDIDEDPRTVRDLFVDRYGAAPISNKFLLKLDEFDRAVLNSNKPIILEIYDNDSLRCLIKSIPIKELFDEDVVYGKMEANKKFLHKYGIGELPALLSFENGKLKAKIEGFYGVEQKTEFLEIIKNILN